MRYPLIHGQGSLGTQEDNDLVASSRYTEARPSKYSDLMMKDFKKKVVPLKETYNGEFMEPVVLPSLFPNAICNGRQAIGISMSHSTPPHNLGEVCDAIVAYLNNNNLTISIAKKGGHIVFSDYNRDVEAETISEEKADEIAKKFLNSKGFSNLITSI